MNQLTQTSSVQESTSETNRNIAAFSSTTPSILTNKAIKYSAPQEVCLDKPTTDPSFFTRTTKALELFLPMQFKFAILLNSTVESLTNVLLYSTINDWYGTRYRYGGTTRRGIDCSAFMQVLGMYGFGLLLPRTAREQYAMMQRVSNSNLKEGDFVFFNTRGGVSHVGMYLMNNKFVHSCTSNGVMISDLSDNYWSSRFICGRRVSGDVAKSSN